MEQDTPLTDKDRLGLIEDIVDAWNVEDDEDAYYSLSYIAGILGINKGN